MTKDSSKLRTFIAIEIPESIRQKIAEVQEHLKKFNERVRWTKPGNIHLTLKFLGEVDKSRIDSIGAALEKASDEFSPIPCSVKNVGAFPNLRQPRILWVGLENPGNELTSLAQKIDAELNNLGFSKEKRKFNAHLTFGRIKSQVSDKFSDAIKNAKFDEEEIRVEKVILMKSDLKPAGAIYTPLKKIKLAIH